MSEVIVTVEDQPIKVSVADVVVQVSTSGPQGPPGTSGGRAMQVVSFNTPQTSWVIDLGSLCDVQAIDSDGNVVWPGTVKYGPGTQVVLTFSVPFSGKAHCYF